MWANELRVKTFSFFFTHAPSLKDYLGEKHYAFLGVLFIT